MTSDLHLYNRLEYDRRYERGRQFFFGPPDEEYAKVLRDEEYAKQKGLLLQA